MTAILAASRVVMRRDGVAALNLNEVARMVGIQTPGLYKYFHGKTGIYDALFRQAIGEFRPRLERMWSDHPPGWGRLEAWMEARMRFAQEHPDLDHLLFSREVPGFTPSDESMAESERLLQASVHAFAQSLQACELHAEIDIDRARGLFFAVMHGLTMLHLANEPGLPAGSGFYGTLIPDAIAALRAGWGEADPTAEASGLTTRRKQSGEEEGGGHHTESTGRSVAERR